MNSMNQRQGLALGLSLLGAGIVAGVLMSGCGSKSKPSKKVDSQTEAQERQNQNRNGFDLKVIREDSRLRGVPSSESAEVWNVKPSVGQDEIIFKDILDLERETYLVWSAGSGDSEISDAVYTYTENRRPIIRSNALLDTDSNRFFIPLIASTQKRPEDIDLETSNSFKIELFKKNGEILKKTVVIRMRGPVGKVTHSDVSISEQMKWAADFVHKMNTDGLVVSEEVLANDTAQSLTASIELHATQAFILSGVQHNYSVSNGREVQGRTEFFKSKIQLGPVKWARLRMYSSDSKLTKEFIVEQVNNSIKLQLLPKGHTTVEWLAVGQSAVCQLPQTVQDQLTYETRVEDQSGGGGCENSIGIQCPRGPKSYRYETHTSLRPNEYLRLGSRIDFSAERTVRIFRGGELPGAKLVKKAQNSDRINPSWADFSCQGII